MIVLSLVIWLQRCMPKLEYHHWLMICLGCTLTVTAILVAGSGATSIAQNVYLIELSYVNHTKPMPEGVWDNATLPAVGSFQNTQLAVRIGYFGLCSSQGDGAWKCAATSSDPAGANRAMDPADIVLLAENLKENVFFPGFLLGGIGLGLLVIVLLSTFPTWRTENHGEDDSSFEVRPFPNRVILLVCVVGSALGTLFAFVAALWQHGASITAATVLETSTLAAAKATIGSVGTGLAWISFALWSLVFVLLLTLKLSIVRLNLLVGDE